MDAATPPVGSEPRSVEGSGTLGAPGGTPGLQRPIWLGLLAITAAICIGNYVVMAQELSQNGYFLAADFIVFWTAADATFPYDFEALTAAQRWYIESEALRPFAYPPSFLPWLQPFAWLPLLPAHALWVATTLGAFLTAWRGILPRRAIFLTLAAPTVLLAAVPGQVVFLIGSLTVFGLRMTTSSPIRAGILFGLAATIKPQALLLLPLALAAGGHWRTLASATLTGAAVGTICVLLQGPEIWIEWLRALPRFMQALQDVQMLHFSITPAGALRAAGVEGWPAQLITIVAAACGILALWRLYRSSDDVALRVLALNVSTLLVLPYAMPYELALSAPVAAAILLDRKKPQTMGLGAFMIFTATGKALALAVMCSLLWIKCRDRIRVATVRGDSHHKSY